MDSDENADLPAMGGRGVYILGSQTASDRPISKATEHGPHHPPPFSVIKLLLSVIQAFTKVAEVVRGETPAKLLDATSCQEYNS